MATPKEWLELNMICPDLSDIILSVAHNTKRGSPIELQDSLAFEGISLVFKSHTSIVWILFLYGCLSHEWIMIQQNYLKWMENRKSDRQ